MLPQSPIEMRKPQFRIGVVIACSPTTHTVDVKLNDAEEVLGVPILGTYGASFSTDMSWLQHLRGAQVVLIYLLNQYFMLSTMPTQITESDDSQASHILEPGYGGDEQLTYRQDEFRNFHSSRPQDFLPGDKVIRAASGSLLAALSEGVAIVRASHLSQIILGRFKDFCRIISRKFELFTDFGDLTIWQKVSGRVGMYLRGGADFLTETHPTIAKWTVQAWVGDDPANADNRLHIRINDTENAEYVTLEMDIKGNMRLDTSKDREAHHGQDEKITIDRDREKTITRNETVKIDGDRDKTIAGKESIDVGGKQDTHVGGKLTIVSDTKIILQAPKVEIN